MKLKLYLFAILVLNTSAVFSQLITIRGKVTDQSGEAVPFATVYQKGTTKGTSANVDGNYLLKLSAGKTELIFKSMGYGQESRELELKAESKELNGEVVLNVVLKAEIYQLKDVVITAGKEDPAYEIIRQAIRKRKAYLNETESYSCRVYIKGLQKMLSAPKKFFGRDIAEVGKEIGLDSNRRGILYLSESESIYSVLNGESHEEMISSKVSGSNRSFSFNRASELDVNFYKNLQDWEGLTNRPLISPIADNALNYYNYKFLGTFTENGELVNKIRVIPKRKAEPVFAGDIYITEDSWRIYSAELMLTKDANINFVDTVKVKQSFFPAKGNTWMPSAVTFNFAGGLFGFRFGGYYTAVYRDYELSPKLNKKLFAEVLKVTRDVNKKDSTYWQEARPIPLTEEEREDYKKKESLAAKRESKSYLDSIDQKYNKFKLKSLIYGSGYSVRNRYKKEYYSFNSILESTFYNTVEGFGISYDMSYRKQVDSARSRNLFLSANLRYGLSSERFLGSVSASIPFKSYPVSLSAGSTMLDLNSQGTISPFGNTVNSLLFERNFMKIYKKEFVSIASNKRIAGLLVSAQAEWSDREWLPNSSDYTIRDLKDRAFTSNNPFLPATDAPLFPNHQSLRFNIRATYEFSKKYVTYPTFKAYLPSKYPRFGVSYAKGIKNVLGSDVDYDLLSTDISKQQIPLGLHGKFSFMIGAGKFLNNKQVYYTDFKHFAGNQALRYQPKINGFLFLDYYRPSTSKQYLEGHVEHNFAGILTNKLPVLRKLKLQEIVGVNYLTSPDYKQYREVYFGLEYLGFRAYYGYAWQGAKQVDSGFRIVYGF